VLSILGGCSVASAAAARALRFDGRRRIINEFAKRFDKFSTGDRANTAVEAGKKARCAAAALASFMPVNVDVVENFISDCVSGAIQR
jgi:hypothetical protein